MKFVDDIKKMFTCSCKKEVKQENVCGKFITIDDVAKVKLIVGEIVECKPVENSEKLLCMKIDMGELGTRQVLAGVAKFFSVQDLIGKQGVYAENLAPRKMMGVESQGMMLFAKDKKGKMEMATVGGKVENGTRLM
jgi:methionyl-tRNA synthetase